MNMRRYDPIKSQISVHLFAFLASWFQMIFLASLLRCHCSATFLWNWLLYLACVALRAIFSDVFGRGGFVSLNLMRSCVRAFTMEGYSHST